MRIADSSLNTNLEGERKAVLLKAVHAIDSLQSKLDAVERDRTEPIAIVGLSCRFPGSQDPDAFWRLLSEGIDAVKEVPASRWNKNANDEPDSLAGKKNTRYGGLLDQVDMFDPGFFGISGREAESMDPQQRLLLEVAWEALENAGIAPTLLRGSATGVFVGITTSDYAHLAVANNATELDVYTATGCALNVAAGRLSYVLGLNGPAMAVDTACSSSLVAVHLACQSLRGRECDLALAGGVNLLLTPEPFICLSKMGMMAPDGRCKTFDERADGFVRGEGCGIIALKRLSDALAADDHILALIRGTAVNQDGASSGLTVPNGRAQQALIRAALKAARLEAHDLDYVEAHGTGTALGDPIELEALATVLGKNRPTDQPLRVGSVKANFGHLESAAGIAGLIKVVLSMGHEEIPRQLHFCSLNPRISLGNAPIEIPVDAIAWPRSERPRIAGVSSFGFSGTNAHAILEEAPRAKESLMQQQLPDRSAHLMVLSASSETALRDLSLAYAEHLAQGPGWSLPDICHTAAIGRSALSHRLAFPASNSAVARELLDAFVQGKSRSEIVSGRVRSDSRVAFLFTGQGAQYEGMARGLYEIEPVFRDAFDQCALLLGEHLDRPLHEIVGYGPDSSPAAILSETQYTQPAIFAVEYALAMLWRSWGIEPAAIVGHSVGEYVGACVAGALSLKDALRLVAVRSLLMQSLPRNGAMAAVFAGEERVRATITAYTDSVSIAATNSPLNTVISGKTDDVRAVLELLRREDVESKPLTVSHAFHSPLVEPILDEFEKCARTVEYRAPVVDLVLNLTGRPLGEALPLDANYWRRHARETVRFAESIRNLHARGIRAFVEIGPAPVLIGMARQCVGESETTWLTSLRKNRDDEFQMLSSLGTLFVLGAKPNWGAYDQRYRRRRVVLPTYPFQRERHWLPVASTNSVREPTQTADHPLLGKHVPLASHPGEHVWFAEISLELCPWIDDNRVLGVVAVPPTVYVEMAIAAAVEAVSEVPMALTRIEFEKMLLLQPKIEFEIQTRLEQQAAGNFLFQVHSRRKNSKGGWTLHASGSLQVGGITVPVEKFDASKRAAFEKRSTRCLDGAEFYRLHKERGNQWGPCFQGISHAWHGKGEALSEVTVRADIQSELSQYVFHPAFSDSLGQILTATIPLEKSDGTLGGAFVGTGIEEVRVYRRPQGRRFYAYAQLHRDEAAPENTLVGDVKIFDSSGNLIIEILGACLWYLDSAQKRDLLQSVEDWLYEPKWEIKEPTSELSPDLLTTGTWIVFRDQQGIGDAVCAELGERGARCLCVDYGVQRSQSNNALMMIRPDNADDYDGVLRAAAQQNSSVNRIVHLWSLDAADLEKADVEAVQEAQTLGPVSVLQLVQALDRARLQAHPKLWLISQGAQPAGEKPAPLSVLQSPLWGLGRTIATESADFWGGMVDLDPADSPAAAAALLLCQLAEPSGEDQTAFRDGRRRVPRLVRRAKNLSKPERVPIRPDATYLITGGLGGIGLIIAHWLVKSGARHLILAGRNSLPPRKQWQGASSGTMEGDRIIAIRGLESLGANVQTVCVDMGNDLSVKGMIGQCLRADQPPLRGVFHAAGVTQNELLVNQSPEQMRDILAAKMVGGWLLHRLLADIPLELFVLFSAFSSFLGSPMLGSYSAANMFLDALACHRRSLGQVGLSVNWGPWGEAGMAARILASEKSKGDRWKGVPNGVDFLSTQRALEALERLLEEGAVQTGVMSIDWKAWHRWTYGDIAVPPYLSALISSSDSTVEGETAKGDSHRELILGVQSAQRAKMVDSYLTEEMARILKVSLASVDRDKPIVNMGVDSLMSIELKNQIETDLGVSVAMASLMQGPTILELTDFVVNLLVGSDNAGATAMVDSSIGEFEEGVL
jgi:myxalamid-type polyketide synthase MxaC